MRLRAIFCALYFGLMPSWVYEKEPHYPGSYFNHMRLNLEMVFIWGLFKETPDDCYFEKKLNPDWRTVCGKLLRWQKGAQNK